MNIRFLIDIVLSLDVDISKLNPVFIQMLALQRIKQLLPSSAKTEPPSVKTEPCPTMEVDKIETKLGKRLLGKDFFCNTIRGLLRDY